LLTGQFAHLQSFNALGNIFTKNATLIGLGVGASVGAGGGLLLSEFFEKKVKAGYVDLEKARKEFIDFGTKFADAKSEKEKKSLKTLESIVKMAATLSSSISDGKFAAEDLVKEYLRRARIPEALALYS